MNRREFANFCIFMCAAWQCVLAVANSFIIRLQIITTRCILPVFSVARFSKHNYRAMYIKLSYFEKLIVLLVNFNILVVFCTYHNKSRNLDFQIFPSLATLGNTNKNVFRIFQYFEKLFLLKRQNTTKH